MVRGFSRAARGLARAHQKSKKKREEEEDEAAAEAEAEAEAEADGDWERRRRTKKNLGPRSFPADVKDLCWQNAEIVKGRDPARWRRDAVGNLVFRKLVGCSGCLCYDYDHIVPYSKGGTSTLDNCQVMQAKANRVKGNRVDVSTTELAQKSAYCRLSGRDMDMVEISAFGDVHREQEGCQIQ